MLAAIYGAIFSAQRLVRPVQDLIAGTRAVGKGDFATRLPLPSRDEMGFLVHSFNDMTKRLRRAREEATRSQEAVERERERLAIILARLSTGVLAHRPQPDGAHRQPGRRRHPRHRPVGGHRPRAAGARRQQRAPRPVRRRAARCASPPGARSGASSSISTAAPGGATLMCACTPLPGEDSDMRLRHRVRRHHARCCRRSAMPPGARSRAAWRTRSRTR